MSEWGPYFEPESWDSVPAHLRPGLEAHVRTGRPVGEFLTALLCNDLRDAVLRADEESLAALRGLLQFLSREMPGACWGSPERVTAWRARGGLAGHPFDSAETRS